MTKQIASLMGLALLAAVSASAQIRNRVEVNVPFSFVAAGKTWDAGTYKIDIRPDTGVTVLYSGESGARAFLMQTSQPPNIGNETTVRFQQYGDQWVLRAITFGGTRADVLPGKREREFMTRKASEPRIVIAHLGR